MFLGNLSASTERKARKPKADKSLASASQDANPLITDEVSEVSHIRRFQAGERPILYTRETNELPRDVLMDYFRDCAAMLLDDRHIRDIISDSISKRIGLHQMAVEFQRDVLENNFQIERDYGCQYLGNIPQRFPLDTELIEGAKDFMLGCMRGYLKAVKNRSKMYKAGTLSGPLPNENLTRTSILEFFEACNALMGMPETRKELREIYLRINKIPNERVIEMQRNLLKQLGYHPDFAVSCLNRIGQDFPNDREVMMKMQFFAVGAEVSCHISTMDEAEFANFMKTIPPLLCHCPQVHVLQQRMMQHQQQMIQQQMAGQHAQMNAKHRELDTRALQNSGMLSFLSTPEGRVQLQTMAAKVSASRKRAEEEMATWDNEKKADYFASFEAHPVLEALSNSSVSANPVEKMKTLLSFSEGDLDSAMKMIVLLNQDASGDMMNQIRQKAAPVAGIAATTTSTEASDKPVETAATEGVSEKVQRSQALHSMVAALSSLDNMKTAANANSGGGHVHSASCSHGAPATAPANDVSKSAGISMER